jgi:hypothetical protein
VRILDFLTHMGFQHSLCRTGHEFHVAPSELWSAWDESYRPWPGSHVHRACDPLQPETFDLAIAATIPQYQRIAASSVPKIFLSHMHLYPWARTFFESLPGDVEVVYVSDHKRSTFGELGRRGRTIRLAADTRVFHGYTGEKACILNVTDAYARREAFRGYALFRELTAGLPFQVVGHGNQEIPGAFPARDFAHMRRIYREHRCFLSTDRGGYLHLSVLEAMATGLPLVALPIPELAPYLENGVNAFLSPDAAELRKALECLLADPELAREVGARGREVVERHFGIDAFVEQWNRLFDERGAGAEAVYGQAGNTGMAPKNDW